METMTKAIEMHHVPDEPLTRGAERLHAASADSTFVFTKAAEEDTYTLADGRSFYDQGEFMSQESCYQTSVTRKT